MTGGNEGPASRLVPVRRAAGGRRRIRCPSIWPIYNAWSARSCVFHTVEFGRLLRSREHFSLSLARSTSKTNPKAGNGSRLSLKKKKKTQREKRKKSCRWFPPELRPTRELSHSTISFRFALQSFLPLLSFSFK